MSHEQQALLQLMAAGAVGYVYQWALFGPQKIPSWVAWSALAATTISCYWWATPSFVADFAANWRLSTLGVITFFLTAKGAGSSAAAAKIAPKSNTL